MQPVWNCFTFSVGWGLHSKIWVKSSSTSFETAASDSTLWQTADAGSFSDKLGNSKNG